jgi:soluble lytic murein transglycosylase-like protein
MLSKGSHRYGPFELFSGYALILSAQCTPSATPAHPATGVAHWQLIAAKAASTLALPEAWLNAVMARESGGKTVLNGRPITSAAGTMGLMQVMPRTYDDLRKQLGLGADPYAPADNITAGAAYLQQMYRRYGYPGMFAAYNAGSGRFDDFLLRQRPLPSVTLAYVAKIAPGAETAFSSIGLSTASLTPRVASPRLRAHSEALFVSLDTHSALFVLLSQPNP